MLNGLRSRAARLLQRPGSADIQPYLKLLPDIAGREQALAALSDSELTVAARIRARHKRKEEARRGAIRLAREIKATAVLRVRRGS